MTLAYTIVKIHKLYGVTYRECQVLLLAGYGIPYKGMADILEVSGKTVEKMMTHIHEKMSVSHTSQIIHRLIADGVISAVRDWAPYTQESFKLLFLTIPQTGSGQSINTLRKLILANEQTKD